MKEELSNNQINHLGIIIDGNRRWAKDRGLSSQEGHKQGYERVKEAVEWCYDRGIKTVTIYAFSIENWKRAKEEVDFLLNLLLFALKKDLSKFIEKDIKLNIIGRRDNLKPEILKAIEGFEKKTRNNKKGVLNLAFNYGGRSEIVEAIKKIVEDKIPVEQINEDLVSKNIFTAGQADPDLIIRTSGEQRLSGFLTWQSVYSELYFSSVNWPDFSENDLDKAIDEYSRRKRRFGGG